MALVGSMQGALAASALLCAAIAPLHSADQRRAHGHRASPQPIAVDRRTAGPSCPTAVDGGAGAAACPAAGRPTPVAGTLGARSTHGEHRGLALGWRSACPVSLLSPQPSPRPTSVPGGAATGG